MAGLRSFYSFIEERLLYAFEDDERNFNESYLNSTAILNIISIIFSIMTFLFIIIFIFISISKFTEPIKEATYRINCLFHYVKIYSLTSYRKLDTNFNIK